MIKTFIILQKRFIFQINAMMLPRHKDMTVYLGNSALLECQAQGLPIPNISWVLPDRSVVRAVSNREQKVVLFTNGTLQVKNTNYLDKGIYKCIASNAAGADMLSVRLQIAALPPTIQEQLWENHTISDGQSAFMHCTAKGAPGPAVRWVTFTECNLSLFIARFSFDRRMKVLGNGTLTITSVTEKDEGDYLCVARNKMGDDYVLLKVNVIMKAHMEFAPIKLSAKFTKLYTCLFVYLIFWLF
uniref:Immunoglobulin superfamily member 10-like n=1 Tax=Sinocyclocheilus rhinocerous TaxID=307959 RepID=A0A673LMQ7_9TELE